MSTTKILNWKRGPEDQRDYKSQRFLQAPLTLPANFKLDRDIPIYDQLDVGSCVGNSVCEGFRYEYAQVKNNFSFNPSRLFAYYNARKLQGWENEDSGAYIRDGFKAMSKWGLASEDLWPYITSKVTDTPPDSVYQNGLNQLVVKYASVQKSESVIKQTIFSGAGVVIGFDVYSSFWGTWSETTGIMPIPKAGERFEGGHAVILIGWDDAKKSFLVQNSWGTDWGQNGYFWMPYAYVVSTHADDFWCIEEIKLVEVNPEPEPTPEPTGCLDPFKLFNSYKELTKLSKAFLVKVSILLGIDTEKKTKAKLLVDLKEYLKL